VSDEALRSSERTVDLSIGMATTRFVEQPVVSRQAAPVSEGRPSFMSIGEPHMLKIHLNGKHILAPSGGAEYPTRVSNDFLPGNSGVHGDRIGSITFTYGPHLSTLDDAINNATRLCQAMRSAGLLPREDTEDLAVVSEQLGSGKIKLASSDLIKEAFVRDDVRAISVVMCSSTDQHHSFGLTLINTRRFQERYRQESESAEASREPAYRLEVYLAQRADAV
jgi:hypothetical protein